MSDIVELDIKKWRELYSNITATDAQLEMYFVEATMLLNNTEHSCVKNLKEREMLLYLLMAHIATLQNNADAGNNSVGRASSASEGSVSISLDYGTTSDSEKWYIQTPYGAKYWQLTARYRSFLYVIGQMPMRVRR
ncbi:DUF4054 domain-containing protein [Xenorhabdus bovienii]|uniref:DUF4054 domain-containing protein n=1 Tax=Xenorhabdus bovienii TaxID=40576 RepID=UPI00237C8961|nr:DUF4054 domain-containing protein [Xenorhabdus bovienii]MDE1486080.1 DUF4054 domain-containing protein [Xenorhabdus bovienii]MDE9478817.1 DUF4054 domain-containing protein [Xenorhabdus bovienii]MDE9518973.1 DUF4054 domain-containing protein [Xenorhabdus bovienii]MDE9531721.1 DUF4054 domain-containing protein [Xenorhabdus bovienii]